MFISYLPVVQLSFLLL